MVDVNSHEIYMECSLGVFNGNLLESRIKRMPTVKRDLISVISPVL